MYAENGRHQGQTHCILSLFADTVYCDDSERLARSCTVVSNVITKCMECLISLLRNQIMRVMQNSNGTKPGEQGPKYTTHPLTHLSESPKTRSAVCSMATTDLNEIVL